MTLTLEFTHVQNGFPPENVEVLCLIPAYGPLDEDDFTVAYRNDETWWDNNSGYPLLDIPIREWAYLPNGRRVTQHDGPPRLP